MGTELEWQHTDREATPYDSNQTIDRTQSLVGGSKRSCMRMMNEALRTGLEVAPAKSVPEALKYIGAESCAVLITNLHFACSNEIVWLA
jgi:hypothetical protein